MKQEIRLATNEDEADLVRLLREMHTEAGIGEFSEAQARLAVEMGVSRNMGMIGVIRGAHGIEASVGLFVTKPTAFSKDAVISDLWLYVRPLWRRSSRAKELLEFSKWVATQLNKPLLMTALSNDLTQRKVELFERQLPRAGSVFLFTPKAA